MIDLRTCSRANKDATTTGWLNLDKPIPQGHTRCRILIKQKTKGGGSYVGHTATEIGTSAADDKRINQRTQDGEMERACACALRRPDLAPRWQMKMSQSGLEMSRCPSVALSWPCRRSAACNWLQVPALTVWLKGLAADLLLGPCTSSQNHSSRHVPFSMTTITLPALWLLLGKRQMLPEHGESPSALGIMWILGRTDHSHI